MCILCMCVLLCGPLFHSIAVRPVVYVLQAHRHAGRWLAAGTTSLQARVWREREASMGQGCNAFTTE